MAQNNLANKQLANQPSKHHLKYNSSLYINPLNHNPKTDRLSLSKYERDLIVVGSIVIVTLMLLLVGTKVSGGVYQHSIQNLTFRKDRVHGYNNNLHQRISGLENNGRLLRIAKQNHLKLSDRNIRNVR